MCRTLLVCSVAMALSVSADAKDLDPEPGPVGPGPGPDYELVVGNGSGVRGDAVAIPVFLSFANGDNVSGFRFGVCSDASLVEVNCSGGVPNDCVDNGIIVQGADVLATNGGAGANFFGPATTTIPFEGWNVGCVIDLLGMESLPPQDEAEIVVATYRIIGQRPENVVLSLCETGDPLVLLSVGLAGGGDVVPLTSDGFIEIESSPANDLCQDAEAVREDSFPFDNTGAGTDFVNSPACSGSFGDTHVWFLYTPSSSGVATVSTCASLGILDTIVTMFTADTNCGAFGAGDVLACNDDAGCGPGGVNSRFEVRVTGGNSYLIAIGGFGGEEGDGVLDITLVPCDPVSGVAFSATPPTLIPRNGQVSFEGSALGSEPLTFEWDFDEDGETDATGPTVTATFPNPGVFDVTLTVTNNCGVGSATLPGLVTVAVPGDFDGDGRFNVNDPMNLANFLFVPGSSIEPQCEAAMDYNASTTLDGSDVILFLIFLFVPGSPPPVIPPMGTGCEFFP